MRERGGSQRSIVCVVKLRTLLTVFTFILKAKAHDYGKGHYISHKGKLWPNGRESDS